MSDRLTQFYEGIETGTSLNDRLRAFVDAYRAHRAALGRPVTVLDIGCGREAVLSRAVRPDDVYVGCDIVAPKVQLASFVRADVNKGRLKDAFESRTFDVIFCGELIEHVFSPDELLEDLRALMHDGSLLILSTPNLAYWLNRVLLPLGISPLFLENSAKLKLGRRFRALGQRSSVEGHIHVFTHRAMMDLLALHPFAVTRVIPVPVWGVPIDRLVCRFSPALSPCNVYLLAPIPQ